MNRLGIGIGIVIVVCGLLAVIFLPGCTEAYAVEVRGTVRNEADGKPLAGVMVYPPEALASVQPIFTGNDGTFSIGRHDVEGDRWWLTLSRDGFVDEVVDIDPLKGFVLGKGAAPTLIVVVISMRANR